MALELRIKELVIGDNFNVERTVLNVPAGQTIAEAWFTIRRNVGAVDYIFQKHITTVYAAGVGQVIDVDDQDETGSLSFELVPADTGLLEPYIYYYYDIQVKTSLDKIYTPERGLLYPDAEITLAS